MLLVAALVILSFVSFVAYEVAEPDDGPVHAFLEPIESRLPDDLVYSLHSFLGLVFAQCPCTADLSTSQYEKAAFHHPSPSPR